MITGTWKSCGRWNDGALVKEDTRFNVFFQTTLTSNKCDCITFMKENSASYGERVGGASPRGNQGEGVLDLLAHETGDLLLLTELA